MEEKNLKHAEVENSLQRFMQIRDQVHDEIKKIGTHVTTLDETNKRLIAHFDVFEKLSKKSEDQIYAAIKAAANDLTRKAEDVFSPLIEELLREQILKLDQAVATAKRALDEAVEKQNKRPLLYTLLWYLFLTTAGFGLGSFVFRHNMPILPEEFIQKIDFLGQKVDTFLKKNSQTRR